jgi:hypothetical protein
MKPLNHTNLKCSRSEIERYSKIFVNSSGGRVKMLFISAALELCLLAEQLDMSVVLGMLFSFKRVGSASSRCAVPFVQDILS